MSPVNHSEVEVVLLLLFIVVKVGNVPLQRLDVYVLKDIVCVVTRNIVLLPVALIFIAIGVLHDTISFF